MRYTATHDTGSVDGVTTYERMTVAFCGPAPTLAPIEANMSATLDDIRQRIAEGASQPVLARHMTDLGLDGVLLALAEGA